MAGLVVGFASPTASAAKVKRPTVKSLLGKEFKLVKVKGNRLLKGKALQLRFFRHANEPGRPKRATMVFSGGCNTLGSRYRVRKGRLLSRGPLSGTSMGCKPNTDPWMIRNFRKGMKARTIGRRLVLTRPARGIRLVYRQVIRKRSAPVKPEPDYPFPVGKPVTIDDLEGRSFESVKVIGEQVKKPIEISFLNGRLSAYLGCNRMSGEYRIDGLWAENEQLRWLGVITTDMLCQGSKDRWFGNLLDKGVEATVKDSWLVLTRGKTAILFKLVAEVEPPERVSPGEPATVESLDGRSFESVRVIGKKLTRPIEISFGTGKVNRWDDEGNQVVGNSLGAYLGCNWKGGEYQIENGELNWLDVVSTLIYCWNDSDSWFTKLLRQGVEASESEAGLIFDRGPTQIVFKEVPCAPMNRPHLCPTR